MPRLNDARLNEALASLHDWRHEDGQLVRDFEFRDAVEALGFIVRVAALQERANHHATITATYNRVGLALTTHDEGGITDRDVALARDIDERA
ncbi:MAG: 4a-hydroxytetrahydrobiopterin dehydratase [Dehalococcoidia bacterium]